MQAIYLVPIITVGNGRGPKYFAGRVNPDGIRCTWAMMDYGFNPYGLLVARDISDADHAALIKNADVFAFPEKLDAPVDQGVQAFFEGIRLPTDWLTPSTTWRELLRQVAGIFQFNQRYGGIAADETGTMHSIFDTATLSTRLRQMTKDEQRWFLATAESFGYEPTVIKTNTQLRQLVKTAGNYWAGRTFHLGGLDF